MLLFGIVGNFREIINLDLALDWGTESVDEGYLCECIWIIGEEFLLSNGDILNLGFLGGGWGRMEFKINFDGSNSEDEENYF